jgi:zinc/manganese transport system substrate-binding protein
MNRRLIAASALVLPALALAGCAGTPTEAEDTSAEGDAFRIVASTSVYSSIAEQLVGDAAEVSAIVDSPTQDPHSYEATARDRLAVEGADLVILNGGGYDHFMEELAEEAGVEHVITVVEYSHDYPGGEGHEHAEDEHAEGDEHAHEEAEGAEDHDHDHEARTSMRTRRATSTATSTSRASTSTSGTTRTPSRTSPRTSPASWRDCCRMPRATSPVPRRRC